MVKGSPPSLHGKAAETRGLASFMPTLVDLLPPTTEGRLVAEAAELLSELYMQLSSSAVKATPTAELCQAFT
eukprot:5712995-Amphidinium_carterae.1